MISTLKDSISEILNKFKYSTREYDEIVNFILKDHIGTYEFNTGIRILPIELIEKYGTRILQDGSEYAKFYNPSYDPFYIEWAYQLEGYWRDKLKLAEEYFYSKNSDKTPFEISNSLNDLVIKIEKRSILLKPCPTTVEQKHPRVNGDEKDYIFVRSYWIDNDGKKKRMISRHIGQKYTDIENEVIKLFMNRGYQVSQSYRSNNTKYDAVVRLGNMLSVVEIKLINEDIFTNLFLFDELLNRFKEEYPME